MKTSNEISEFWSKSTMEMKRMQELNLMKELEMKRMKESETTKE